MKKTLLLIVCSLFFLVGYSQDYIYSFEGTTDLATIEKFETSLNAVTGVELCKVKMKENSTKGQISIYLKPEVSATDLEKQFSPVFIKTLILEYNFTPLQFIESK